MSTDDGSTVKLAASSLIWQVLANMVGAAVVCAVMYGRLVAVETTVSAHAEQLTEIRQSQKELRADCVNEIRALREEVTK